MKAPVPIIAMMLAAAPPIALPVHAQDMDHSGETVGDDPAPPVPTDHPADAFFPASRMAAARAALLREGAITASMVLADRLEYRSVRGEAGYGWKAQGWYGGDRDRVVLTSEGEGSFDHAPERAEAALLWRHALDPWFNLESGVRHDFGAGPQTTYAVLGVEGLAPYWFELEGQLLLSQRGDVHLRAAASYDQRITQRLILQPAVEVNMAFQSVPELRIGAGVERVEAGARLRYEVTPEFAPYIGVHWETKPGSTGDMARKAGERASSVAAVLGLRIWF